MIAIITDTNSVIFRTFDSIIDGCHLRSSLLFEGEFLGAGYPQQGNGKNNVYKDIHITITNYYPIGSLRGALEAHLIGPLQYDLIDEQDNEPDTDQEDRIPTQIPIVMRDHEIYFSNAHQYDHKRVENLEVGRPIGDTTQNNILDHPDQRDQHHQQVENPLIVPQQAPHMELPGDQYPFQKPIDIVGYAVVMHRFEHNITDQLIDHRTGQHEQKGPVHPAQTAVTYQPHYKRQEFEFTQ